jgi:hypothetical protein
MVSFLAVLTSAATAAEPSAGTAYPPTGETPRATIDAGAAFPMVRVPPEELPPAFRAGVTRVLEHPTLCTRGPAEAFRCRPDVYQWLLEHPDLAARLWRGLGAQCAAIESIGEGRFRWVDPQAGEIRWQTVQCTPRQRVWYAEGRVRPAPWLPATGVQAVVVLQYVEGTDRAGRPALRHQMDLMLHTDSRALALAARVLGASAPHAAAQYVGQLETFFGGLAWYLSEDPERARALLRKVRQPAADAPAAGPTPGVPPPAGGVTVPHG